jgi:hypothetical protein
MIKILSDYTNLDIYRIRQMNYIEGLNWLLLRHQEHESQKQ